MTIRTRLLITNILMILIPMMLIAISMVSLTSLTPGFLNPAPMPQLMEAVRLVEDIGDAREQTLEELAAYLEPLGFLLLVRDQYGHRFSNLTYQELAKVEPIIHAVGPGQDLMLLHDKYMIYQRDLLDHNQTQVAIINLSPAGGILIKRLAGISRESHNWHLTALSLVIIAVTNSILAWVITRSIMKPLKKLSHFAREIRDGNLDFPVAYFNRDEFSAVFEDFEEMRSRLKSSVDLQHHYEENRKELLAGISHDLSTPLTSIKGYVSGLMDGIADTPLKQEKYLQTIYNTASAMDNLVEELFLLSKLDLNRVPFYLDRVDLAAYFKDCAEELQLLLDKHNLELKLLDSPSPIYANIDPNQFYRVIRNIIDNSAKYKTKASGTITINLSATEDTAVITLQDDGQGLEQAEADKIFQSFYRADPSRQNPGKGSGLGLAIARRIIEQLQGTIRAESTPGAGMSIIIQLPRVQEAVTDETNPNS